jgi:hypothetical protein
MYQEEKWNRSYNNLTSLRIQYTTRLWWIMKKDFFYFMMSSSEDKQCVCFWFVFDLKIVYNHVLSCLKSNIRIWSRVIMFAFSNRLFLWKITNEEVTQIKISWHENRKFMNWVVLSSWDICTHFNNAFFRIHMIVIISRYEMINRMYDRKFSIHCSKLFFLINSLILIKWALTHVSFFFIKKNTMSLIDRTSSLSIFFFQCMWVVIDSIIVLHSD